MKIQNRVHTASGFSVTITGLQLSRPTDSRHDRISEKPSVSIADTTQKMPERKASSTGPGLLSIPPEIRDMIYDHLLPDIQEFRCHPELPGVDQQLCPPAIARVHPKIRAEVLSRTYTNLRVCITQTTQTSSFTKWLGRCNVDVLQNIRSIVIILRMSHWIFSNGALFVELTSDPTVNIRWQKESYLASLPNLPIGIAAQQQPLFHWQRMQLQRSHRQRVNLMNAAKTAVSRIMESCMPKHPHYDRRVFTQHAFMALKAELWYELGFRWQRETVLEPAAKKTAALRVRRRRQRRLGN
ncbi:hypothetical protein MBLNU457_g0961t1 [Dothideomycetes sp. NU457]